MLKRYGDKALGESGAHADELVAQDDYNGAAAWRRITRRRRPSREPNAARSAYGPVGMVAGPLIDRLAPPPRVPAPAIGADTDAVLRGCGFSETGSAALPREGVV